MCVCSNKNRLIVIIYACSSQGIAGFTDNIPVAVKTLSSTDPAVVNKFMEEAELMKKFSHPNIVSLLGKQLLG